MKKSTKKTYLFLALVLIFVSFAPIISVNAWGHRAKVTYRPLTDWTKNNPRVVYGFTTNWDLLPEGYLLRFVGNPNKYCGYITEKLLEDGISVEITVFIMVRNCEIHLWGLSDAFAGNAQDILVDTSYSCLVMQKFILPEAGMEIPIIFDIFSGEKGEWVLSYSIGFGCGTFTEYAEKFGFIPGAAGKVFLHQMGFISSEGEEIWPYEEIKVW